MADRKELRYYVQDFDNSFPQCVSFKDFGRLNHLGVCMSHKSMITLQQRMGENFDDKAIIWQKSIECNKINTVNSLVSDHPWGTTKWSLTGKINKISLMLD